MRISIQETDMKDFDFSSAYSKWISARDRKFDSDIREEMAHSYLKNYKTAFDDIITSER